MAFGRLIFVAQGVLNFQKLII